jgi:hypothetical protein
VAETIADWAATDGTVAIRVRDEAGGVPDAADPGLNRVLAAAARHDLPVNLACWGRLSRSASWLRETPTPPW